MEFEQNEKLAIARVLEKVAKADDKIMEEEMQILLNAAKYLEMDDVQIHRSKDLSLQKAGEILKQMSSDKKLFISNTLLKLMAADGTIDLVEVQMMMETFLGEEEN